MTIDGRVVCVRHRAGRNVYHLLPGGGVDFRETLAEALAREVLEETGLKLALGPLLFVSDTIDPAGSRHVINITFAADVAGGAITAHPADRRIEAVDLFEPRELSSLDLRPPIAAFILDALESGPCYRARYLGSLFTQAKGDNAPNPTQISTQGTAEASPPGTGQRDGCPRIQESGKGQRRHGL